MKSTNTLFVVFTAIITGLAVYMFMKPKKMVEVPDGVRSGTSICMDYDTVTPPTLTSKLVQSMVAKYSSTQLNNIQTAANNAVPVDAKSIWFDLETLKRFLYHIEHNVDKNERLASGKNIGVRIYYAAYPKNDDMKMLATEQTDPTFSMNADYQNLHTLVMIPTIADKDGNNYDFNPLDVASYNGFVNMTKDQKSPMVNTLYQVMSLGTAPPRTASSIANTNGQTQTVRTSINARNHGALYPPDNSIGVNFN